MHWKGLWATFAHHGDVIDSFIPTKRRKSGRRFGFVRFASKADASRAISRLNGFILFGNKVSVSYAKYTSRSSFWRKSSPTQGKNDQTIKMNQFSNPLKSARPSTSYDSRKSRNQQKTSLENSGSGHILTSNYKDRERVKGFVEDETLWKLQQCLVGYTAVESDSAQLHERLCKWGLGEIKIKRMAGRVFLLEVEDSLVYSSLKDYGWSYLKEVFTEVHPWSDSFRIPERVVWLELFGVPFHCWNQQTFRRIAEL
ncbi:hypothetical protein GQ457_07G016410 [Hibiscus cannabinus]